MEFTFNEYLGCVEVSSAGKQLAPAVSLSNWLWQKNSKTLSITLF
jgi:hypothetical protein